jgi:flagellin-specific chaperone FliS
MFMGATGAAAYKRAVMSSEVPDLEWIARGWRGLRTYLAAATRALDRQDLTARSTACGRASELLVMLRQITPNGPDCELGERLAAIYDTLHIELAKANAVGDRETLLGIMHALATLEAGFAPSDEHDGAGR